MPEGANDGLRLPIDERGGRDTSVGRSATGQAATPRTRSRARPSSIAPDFLDSESMIFEV